MLNAGEGNAPVVVADRWCVGCHRYDPPIYQNSCKVTSDKKRTRPDSGGIAKNPENFCVFVESDLDESVCALNMSVWAANNSGQGTEIRQLKALDCWNPLLLCHHGCEDTANG
jgi:hypothetical protein